MSIIPFPITRRTLPGITPAIAATSAIAGMLDRLRSTPPATIHGRWQEVRRHFPADDMLVFIRLGDFWETFEDDAKSAAPILNVALTKRNGIPMCGIPALASYSYLNRLMVVAMGVARATRQGDSGEFGVDRVICPPQPAHSLYQPLTPQLIVRRGTDALNRLQGFIGDRQLAAVRTALRGEEGEWFMEKLEELAARVEAMPVTYQTDGLGDDAICHLHYFGGCYDGYITERDMGDVAELGPKIQRQAFGYARFAHMPEGAESGYISLPELFKSHTELDFHFTPVPLREIKRKFSLGAEQEAAAATCLNSDSPPA